MLLAKPHLHASPRHPVVSLGPPTVPVVPGVAKAEDTRGERVRELIEDRGCELLYLPPYSPDLNPIEEAFSKVKRFLRQIGARTRGALVEAMGKALDALTAKVTSRSPVF